MLWTDSGKVGNGSRECEEDEGTDYKDGYSTMKVKTVTRFCKGIWNLMFCA
jgi:hypothetical protein